MSDAEQRLRPAAAPPGPPAELTLAQQRQLVQALVDGLGRGGKSPRHVETHISHVLLHEGHAYKIKKALSNSFLDQSTLALRRAACHEELRLNRRTEPQLYLGVVPITGTPDRPVLGGDGPPLELAVQMRAFDESGLWDRLAARGALRTEDVDALAARLADLHARAAVAPAGGWFGAPEQVRLSLRDSLRDLQAPADDAAWPGADDRQSLALLQCWEAERFLRLEPVLRQRLADGRVREGHGDLHLGNVAREGGRCLVFDGIEFNAAFRWIDVMSDAAFMAMDLLAHRLPGLAHRFVNAYLEHGGDYGGMRVLDYYLVHRALVRAKVARLRAAQAPGGTCDEARAAGHRYVQLAAQLAAPRPRALLITHGLSGSGKTTLTQGLLQTLGAVRVRSDVERKRLAGLAAEQHSRSLPGGGLYGPAAGAATYGRLLEAAAAVLEGGWPVILDATFLRHADRVAARQLAGRLGVPFAILHFTAAPAVLRQRVLQRAALASDASEADETVLWLQSQTQEPLRPDELPLVHAVRAESRPGAAPRADWAPVLARLGLASAPAAPAVPDPASATAAPARAAGQA
ncbi:AAA family ATPase [Rubrivivax sp. RP6-9]|uniref:bifunctional aminoglycoside phosphotransferase/ATP-binding protein n=1 Tax=Rubrivivax sp. RP6-9 TaxID=3415750 RepID=UPI003CC622B9